MARRISALASVKVLPFSVRDDAGDVVDVLFEQHLQLEQRLDAVFGRSAAPFRKGGGGGFDGGVHFGGVGQRNAGQDFARGGIDDVAPFGRSESRSIGR